MVGCGDENKKLKEIFDLYSSCGDGGGGNTSFIPVTPREQSRQPFPFLPVPPTRLKILVHSLEDRKVL